MKFFSGISCRQAISPTQSFMPNLVTPHFLSCKWIYYFITDNQASTEKYYLWAIDSATITQLVSHSLVSKYNISEFRQSPKTSSNPSRRRSKKREMTITRSSSASEGEKMERTFLHIKQIEQWIRVNLVRKFEPFLTSQYLPYLSRIKWTHRSRDCCYWETK
jgi:hypothetical protein